MAASSCCSVQRYRLLPRRTQGLFSLGQQPVSLMVRVAFALNAFKIHLGLQLADTTTCTWFVRMLKAHSSHLRMAHVSRMAFATAALCFESSFAGRAASERNSYCCP